MYRKKAAQCLAEGRHNEARECFTRCIDCTPKMALEVIQVRGMNRLKMRQNKQKASDVML